MNIESISAISSIHDHDHAVHIVSILPVQSLKTKLTSFHVCIICGIPNIACLLFSNLICNALADGSQYIEPGIITYRPFCVLSHFLPLTFSPTPVPFTLRPFSCRFCNLYIVPLTVNGNSSSTPCCRASFTRSACRLNENTGSCHRPVTACFWGWKGFGSCECILDAALACWAWGRMDGGGYRAKNLVNRSGSFFARLVYVVAIFMVVPSTAMKSKGCLIFKNKLHQRSLYSAVPHRRHSQIFHIY